jgi:hypothetical protein
MTKSVHIDFLFFLGGGGSQMDMCVKQLAFGKVLVSVLLVAIFVKASNKHTVSHVGIFDPAL